MTEEQKVNVNNLSVSMSEIRMEVKEKIIREAKQEICFPIMKQKKEPYIKEAFPFTVATV